MNSICREHSLAGEAVLGEDAREPAVIAADEGDQAIVRDTRDFNRALGSDVDGAIEDFEFAIEQRDGWENREEWLVILKAGENPL